VNEKFDFFSLYYEFIEIDVSKIEFLRAFHCLRYQCNEGDFDKTELFQKITNVIKILDNEILKAHNTTELHNIREYNEAQWDSY